MGSRTTSLPMVSCTFRFDPYQTTGERAIFIEEEVFALPSDTLHTKLADNVSFLPYPEEEFATTPPSLPKEEMSRLFLGQLPYQVTDMQIQWLCSTFGNGVRVYYPERIVKHEKKPEGGSVKVPTGCVHAYCRPEEAERLMDGLHKRLLIDDTGVWYADNAEELKNLCRYTSVMKKDRSKRPQNRPYDTVVAQLATSTYVPKPPAYFSRNTPRPTLPSYSDQHSPVTTPTAAIPVASTPRGAIPIPSSGHHSRTNSMGFSMSASMNASSLGYSADCSYGGSSMCSSSGMRTPPPSYF